VRLGALHAPLIHPHQVPVGIAGHHRATRHEQHRPGHPGGLVRCEIDRGRRDVGGLTHPSKRIEGRSQPAICFRGKPRRRQGRLDRCPEPGRRPAGVCRQADRSVAHPEWTPQGGRAGGGTGAWTGRRRAAQIRAGAAAVSSARAGRAIGVRDGLTRRVRAPQAWAGSRQTGTALPAELLTGGVVVRAPRARRRYVAESALSVPGRTGGAHAEHRAPTVVRLSGAAAVRPPAQTECWPLTSCQQNSNIPAVCGRSVTARVAAAVVRGAAQAMPSVTAPIGKVGVRARGIAGRHSPGSARTAPSAARQLNGPVSARPSR